MIRTTNSNQFEFKNGIITKYIGKDKIVIIPKTINNKKVTSIGDRAFESCTGLPELTLPDGVSIGDRAFFGCTGLTELTLPDGVSIGDRAFESCTIIITYRNRTTEIKTFDNSVMAINKKKTFGSITTYHCQYFNNWFKNNNEMEWVASNGMFNAHGKTKKGALNDLKDILDNNADIIAIIEEIKDEIAGSCKQYRALTNSCYAGMQRFINENTDLKLEIDNNGAGKDIDVKIPLIDVFPYIKNEYGYNDFIKLLGEDFIKELLNNKEKNKL